MQSCESGDEFKTGASHGASLFAVPKICEPLASQPISLYTERYEYLSQLNLADPSGDESQLEVDVLIGSDHYWKLATGEVL